MAYATGYGAVPPSLFTNTTSSTINIAGGGGSVLTSTGMNGAYWQDNSSITVGTTTPSLHVTGDKATFDCNVDVKGDLKIKGKSIAESLAMIEERLRILRPNKDLESRWDELREIGERYRELEAELLQCEEVMEILGK